MIKGRKNQAKACEVCSSDRILTTAADNTAFVIIIIPSGFLL